MFHKQKIEYGDFQTPEHLAKEIAAFLYKTELRPTMIVEPTCGTGSFIKAAVETFGAYPAYHAFDINADYLEQVKKSCSFHGMMLNVTRQDFFTYDWAAFFAQFLAENILVIGNPPWVTNAVLSALESANLPQKTNFQGHRGFDAKTGKANFDIAEWMLMRLIESLQRNNACIAMLCKTATARKTLQYAWQKALNISQVSLYAIDAKAAFNVSVGACLFVAHIGKETRTMEAAVYSGMQAAYKLSTFGWHDQQFIANIDEYQQVKDIAGISCYTWRSGVKHDAARVMELTKTGEDFVNGLGEIVDIETEYLYPLLKSSDIGNNRLQPRKYVILPQKDIGEDTQRLEIHAPKTWEYLLRHAAMLDKRKSSIYKQRARFAIFGVGAYSFAPYKVAVSGLYKQLRFVVIGQFFEKPMMVDDTCYFIACSSHEEAQSLSHLLNTEICRKFLHSLIFFDAKRPITKDILQRIDFNKLALRVNHSSPTLSVSFAGCGG